MAIAFPDSSGWNLAAVKIIPVCDFLVMLDIIAVNFKIKITLSRAQKSQKPRSNDSI